MNIPESFIPSLRDEASFNEWRRRNMKPAWKAGTRPLLRFENWGAEGARSMEAEFEPFLAQLLEHCTDRLQAKDGQLKIVTFGAGMLRGILELRQWLLEWARESGLQDPHISLVDFSLTKILAKEGIRREEVERLLQSGDLELHIGPLEVRSIAAADQADVMISAYGPFVHADDHIQVIELVEKAALRLAPKGKAFLQVYVGKPERDAVIIPATLRRDLGQTFIVEMKSANEEWFLEIERID